MNKKLSVLLALIFFGLNGVFAADYYYIQTSNPWGHNYNQTDMHSVFGVGGWTLGNYSTPADTIFAASTDFVFLEGSDSNAIDLQQFLTSNQATIESWVNNGGRLYIKAAPTVGTDINAGFGSTVIHYPYNDSLAHSVDSSSPIFHCPYTPISYMYAGHNVSNSYVTGTGLHTIVDNSAAFATFAGKPWGNGHVFFSCFTDKSFWTPTIQAGNMFENLLFYVSDSIPCYTAVNSLVKKEGNIEVYPNPVQTSLEINSSSLVNSIAVFNSLGQVVLTQNYNRTYKAVLHMEGLQKGLYFVVVTGADGDKAIRKVIKE